MDDKLERLEAVTQKLVQIAAKLGGGAAVEEGVTPQYVFDYEDIVKNEVAAFCEAIGKVPDYHESEKAVNAVQTGFNNVLDLIRQTPACKKPAVSAIAGFLAPVTAGIKVADKMIGSRKGFKRATNNKALYEVLMINSWPSMYPPQLPAAHCKAQYESADFHLNRILMKEKTDENVVFVKTARALMKKVEEYVRQNFKTGLEFVGKGDLGSAAPAEKKAAPAKKAEPKKKAEEDGAKKAQALLGDLQRGVGKDKDASMANAYGLKKVKKSQKNKYSKEKVVGKVTVVEKKAKSKKALPPAKMSKRGPFNWFFENYSEKEELVTITEDTPPGSQKITMKQGLYFANCWNAKFVINCKVKSITLDSCHRTKIQVGDVVSCVDMVNCKSVTVYCNGSVPSLTIDKCESPLIYFNKESLVEGNPPSMTVSNVIAGNVEVTGGDDADSKVYPIPEQFNFKIKDGNVSCAPLKHEG